MLRWVGACFDVAGFVLVAVGIAENHQRFAPELPGIAGQVRAAWRWVVVRLSWRKREHTVVVGDASFQIHGEVMTTRVTVGLRPWDDDVSLDERILDLRRGLETHAQDLDQLHQRQQSEETTRAAADSEQQRQQAAMQETLDSAIKEVAIGGIQRETWGLACFAVGLVLGTIGNALV